MARQRIIVPFAGHVIGEGFNSETVERVGTALSVANVGEDKLASGQTAVFKFQMLTSQASLEKSLNIGAQLDARYALFSGGAKFDFAESSALNSTSTYIVASSVITNALRFGSGFKPNAVAEPLIKAGDEDRFRRAFGDRFTQALHTGGEFHALVRITSSSVNHQRSIAASLHAELNGVFTSVDFQASLQDAQKDTSAHTDVDIQVHQTGGVGSQVQIPGTDADRIRAHMNSFATAAHQNAKAYQAELVTYDTLALPFPSPEELEDRRRVLEDCLQRRQRYWSVISDLSFAQSEEANLIFRDLPPAEKLVELQNDFRRILNDLMAHARAVSRGIIPPEFFEAKDEPPPPRLKRRTAGSFASWWKRRKDNDPTLLQNERFLIDRISEVASKHLTVPLLEAAPETVERAADMIDVISLDRRDDTTVSSLASLPAMTDAPLKRIRGDGTDLTDLTGLEPFTRLELVQNDSGKLRDITSLTSIAGLETLLLRRNNIKDLSPLQSLTRLEVLCLEGNEIRSLEPLRGLHALRKVSVADSDVDNPIVDARALADLPLLANPFTTADQLALTLFDGDSNLRGTGLATRIGNTNRFSFAPDDGGGLEQVLLLGLSQFDDLNVVTAPVIVTGVLFANRGMAVACTRPGDRTASLPAGEVLALFQENQGLRFETGLVTGLRLEIPTLVLEVEAT